MILSILNDNFSYRYRFTEVYTLCFSTCYLSYQKLITYFIFDALCPSKSGLMNKHIVKHIVNMGGNILV